MTAVVENEAFAVHAANLNGRVLIRSSNYVLADGVPALLPPDGYYMDAFDAVRLDGLGEAVRECRSRLARACYAANDGDATNPVGIFASSTEVIAHLLRVGISAVDKVPKAAPRVAVITACMVKKARNPFLGRHDVFFVGHAKRLELVQANAPPAGRQSKQTVNSDEEPVLAGSTPHAPAPGAASAAVGESCRKRPREEDDTQARPTINTST